MVGVAASEVVGAAMNYTVSPTTTSSTTTPGIRACNNVLVVYDISRVSSKKLVVLLRSRNRSRIVVNSMASHSTAKSDHVADCDRATSRARPRTHGSSKIIDMPSIS